MSWLPGLEPERDLPVEADGEGDEWYTPPEVVRAVCAAFGVDRIAVDPCWAPGSVTNPIRAIDIRNGSDGLVSGWGEGGLAFVNPPYSDVSSWIHRCYRQSLAGYDVVMLIPCRPEIASWWRWIWAAGGFPVVTRGRLRFLAPDGTRPGSGRVSTCFIVWSEDSAIRLELALLAEGITACAIGPLRRRP